jgi:hypothetical protein
MARDNLFTPVGEFGQKNANELAAAGKKEFVTASICVCVH